MWNWKRWKRAGAALLLSGALLVGGNQAWAAKQENDGMWAFREAYLAMQQDDRPFNEVISFFGPTFHADLDFKGQLLRDGSLRLAGKLKCDITEGENAKNNNLEVPFYIEQQPSNLAFYVQWSGKWYKMDIPGVPADFASTLKTTDAKEMAANMALVKSVKLLQDDDNQRRMDIRLDGKKVADSLLKYAAENKDTLKPEDAQHQQEILQRFSRVLEKQDVPVTWTVDKKTWRTVTVGMNFTELMRAYAQTALQDAAEGKTKIDDGERSILEMLGYYCELHAYTTYQGMDKQPDLTVPQEVKQSAERVNFLKDIQAAAVPAEKK